MVGSPLVIFASFWRSLCRSRRSGFNSLLAAIVSAALPGVDVASPFPRGFDGDVSVILPFRVSAFITAVRSPASRLQLPRPTRPRCAVFLQCARERLSWQILSAAIFMGKAKHCCAVLGVSGPNHIVAKRLRHQRFPTWAAHVVEAERSPWFPPAIGHSWRGTGVLIRAHL